MAETYTGTDWVTHTKISTDIMKSIDEQVEANKEAIEKNAEDIKENTDLIDSLDVGLYYQRELSSDEDIDSLSTSSDVGYYYANANIDILGNGTTPYGNLFVIVTPGRTIVFQLFFSNTNTLSIYARRRSGNPGTWSAWRQFSLSTISTSSVGEPVVMGDED